MTCIAPPQATLFHPLYDSKSGPEAGAEHLVWPHRCAMDVGPRGARAREDRRRSMKGRWVGGRSRAHFRVSTLYFPPQIRPSCRPNSARPGRRSQSRQGRNHCALVPNPAMLLLSHRCSVTGGRSRTGAMGRMPQLCEHVAAHVSCSFAPCQEIWG